MMLRTFCSDGLFPVESRKPRYNATAPIRGPPSFLAPLNDFHAAAKYLCGFSLQEETPRILPLVTSILQAIDLFV